MKKRVIMTLTGLFVCIILIATAYFLRNDTIKFPSDGIYFYNTEGYVSFASDENYQIPILAVSVHKDLKSPVTKYSKFFLIANDGKEIPVTINQEDKNRLYTENRKYSQAVANMQIQKQVDYLGQKVTFTAMKYTNEKQETIIRDLGTLTVEYLKSANDKRLNIISPTLLRSSVNSKLIFDVEYEVETKQSSNFKLTDVYFGIEGIKPLLDTINYSKENKITKVKFEVNEKEINNDSCIAYVVKPKVNLNIDKESITNTVSNYSVYNTSVQEDRLIKFLLECEKKSNDKIR